MSYVNVVLSQFPNHAQPLFNGFAQKHRASGTSRLFAEESFPQSQHLVALQESNLPPVPRRGQ